MMLFLHLHQNCQWPFPGAHPEFFFGGGGEGADPEAIYGLFMCDFKNCVVKIIFNYDTTLLAAAFIYIKLKPNAP
jgi:hypothetical protein